jgi:hypothetical protein
LTEMVSIERPDWQQIMTYVTNIYKYFETWVRLNKLVIYYIH